MSEMMDISYRPAEPEDLDEILRLVGAAINQMTERGIFQWDEIYPAREDFYGDIQRNELHAGIIGGKIAVVYALSKESDEQYAYGEWQYTGESYMVLHRLCVSPEFQNMGVATNTLSHIEEQLITQGVRAVRLDMFSENPYARKLYSKCGYRITGQTHWRKGTFFLLEKVLVKD